MDVKVRYLRTGQPRPYADTETVCEITFPEPVGDAEVREWMAGNDMTTREKYGSGRDWWEPYLAYIRPLGGSAPAKSWETKTVHPFTD